MGPKWTKIPHLPGGYRHLHWHEFSGTLPFHQLYFELPGYLCLLPEERCHDRWRHRHLVSFLRSPISRRPQQAQGRCRSVSSPSVSLPRALSGNKVNTGASAHLSYPLEPRATRRALMESRVLSLSMEPVHGPCLRCLLLGWTRRGMLGRARDYKSAKPHPPHVPPTRTLKHAAPAGWGHEELISKDLIPGCPHESSRDKQNQVYRPPPPRHTVCQG